MRFLAIAPTNFAEEPFLHEDVLIIVKLVGLHSIVEQAFLQNGLQNSNRHFVRNRKQARVKILL